MLLSHDESEDGVAVVRPNTGHGARRMPLFKLRANYTHCTPKQVNRLSDATVFSFHLHLFVFFMSRCVKRNQAQKLWEKVYDKSLTM